MNEEKDTMGGNCCRGGRKWWFLIPIFAVAGIFGFGLIVMYLWNAVMPEVFTSLGKITYCQAILLLILSKIFFGGFRGRSCGCRCGRGGRWGRGKEWKEKWMNMSEEERAKFKEEWKNRCC